MNHPSFSHYKAVVQLRRLAQQPIQLSEQLTPERIKNYYAEACGLRLLFSTEKVTDEVLAALKQLADESHALQQMEQMQNGEIVNVIHGFASENRPALHTAARDFFNHPRAAKTAYDAALLARAEADKLSSFMAKIELNKHFDEMIVIAIGGSYLGPLAMYKALQGIHRPYKKIHFIANIDPDETTLVLNRVNLKRSLVVVISKSGKTIETATNEEFVRSKFKAQGLKPEEHFMCVTCPGTPMDTPDRYLKIFYMWDWIGGRFSVTSMAGAVILSFAFGFQILWDFLKGAHAMDQVALDPDIHHNLPLLIALLGIWNRDFLHYQTLALIPYSQALARFPAHIQQVAMESNGKRIDRFGNLVDYETSPIIWGEPGTDAQHSFFQLLHQGTTIVPVSMIGFKDSQCQEDIEVLGTTSQEKLLANLFAQAIALATGQSSDNPNQLFPGNRPTHIILGERLTPFTLGALLALFEHVVAFQGFIWNINSFDQEGVQLGKTLATRLAEEFAQQRHPTEKKTSYPIGEAFLQHLKEVKSL